MRGEVVIDPTSKENYVYGVGREYMVLQPRTAVDLEECPRNVTFDPNQEIAEASLLVGEVAKTRH